MYIWVMLYSFRKITFLLFKKSVSSSVRMGTLILTLSASPRREGQMRSCVWIALKTLKALYKYKDWIRLLNSRLWRSETYNFIGSFGENGGPSCLGILLALIHASWDLPEEGSACSLHSGCLESYSKRSSQPPRQQSNLSGREGSVLRCRVVGACLKSESIRVRESYLHFKHAPQGVPMHTEVGKVLLQKQTQQIALKWHRWWVPCHWRHTSRGSGDLAGR